MKLKLKHFQLDARRDLLTVGMEFYQMDLQGVVNQAIQFSPEMNLDELQSWSKACAAPMKAKGFLKYMFEAIFDNKHNAPELCTDIQFVNDIDHRPGKKKKWKQRVALMFMGKIRNDCLELIELYAHESLSSMFVVQRINGDVTNGRRAEKFAERVIAEAAEQEKHVLFIAANMAQRSFSVKQIIELYLAYDKGQTGATIQRMSRALTDWKEGKVSKIVSLAFDADRDDKFDHIVLQTAKNFKEKNNIKSLREAIREVLRTVDIFQCTPDGSVKWDIDTYLESLMQGNRLTRAIGRMVDMSHLTCDQLLALSEGNAQYIKRDASWYPGTRKGKTREPEGNNRPPAEINEEERIQKRARKVIVTFCEHIDIPIRSAFQAGNITTVHDALVFIDNDPQRQKDIENIFDIEYSLAKFILTEVIHPDWLQLLLDR